MIGLTASIPAFVYSFRNKKYIEIGLITIGTPLFTLFMAGCIYWLVNGNSPSFILFMFGAGGAALLFMALKEIRCKLARV